MNFPLKKRRGRPPKYLSVWQHQHHNNTITEYNNNNSYPMNNIRHVAIGQVIDMRKSKAECEGQAKDENDNSNDNSNNNNNNSNSHNNNNNSGQENNNMGDNSCTDNHRVKDTQAKVRTPGDATNTQDPRGQRHGDHCPGSAPVDDADPPPEVRQPDGDTTRQQTATPSESPPTRPSSAQSRDMRDDSRARQPDVTQPAEGSTESRQPMKRRPGRPPGSTKKARAVFPPFAAPTGSEDEFSLRRFFEAGGRDYHEYLEWMKTRRTAVPSPPRMPLIVSPFCRLPMAGNGVRMTSEGFAFPAAPVCRPPVPLPAGVRPVVTAVVAPVTTHPPGASEEDAVGNASFAPQQASFDYKCFTCKPKVARVDSPKKPPPRSEACVLDLSAKRKRSDSDSEKENDCLDMSVNKRQKNDKGHSASDVLIGDKQNPKMDGKHVTDDLVESSTESDVTTSWSVDQVANFVARVPECHVYAEVFRSHRIDGTTLPHLSDEHLLNHVGMKLGHMIHLRLALNRLKSEK